MTGLWRQNRNEGYGVDELADMGPCRRKRKGKRKALPVTQGGQYLFIAKSWLMHKGDKGKAGQESSSLQSRFQDLAISWWSWFSIEKCLVRTYSLSISILSTSLLFSISHRIWHGNLISEMSNWDLTSVCVKICPGDIDWEVEVLFSCYSIYGDKNRQWFAPK